MVIVVGVSILTMDDCVATDVVGGHADHDGYDDGDDDE